MLAFLTLNSPILIALLWAKFTSLGEVRRLMLFYAKLHFAVVAFILLYSLSIDWLCDGDAVKGYRRCSIVPVELANLTLPIGFYGLAGLAALAIGFVVYCGVKEFRRHKRSKP